MSKLRKVLQGILGVFLLGLAILVGSRFTDLSEASGGPLKPSAERDPQRVRTEIVQPQTYFEETISAGTLRAAEAIDLRVEVSGKLVLLAFQEGSRIKQGELLLKVNEAVLAAQLRQVESRKDLARLREERFRSLIPSGGVSQNQLDEAQSERVILEVEADVIREEIKRHSILAPFDGVVGLRYVSEGAYVTPSTDIATFQNIDRVRLDFSLPEKFATEVRDGQTVTFTVASSPGETFEARIEAIEPQIDPQTRTVQVRASADNPDGVLRPGAFARVIWKKNEQVDALFIPAVSLLPSPEGDTGVWTFLSRSCGEDGLILGCSGLNNTFNIRFYVPSKQSTGVYLDFMPEDIEKGLYGRAGSAFVPLWFLPLKDIRILLLQVNGGQV